jgi:hypothetical protein
MNATIARPVRRLAVTLAAAGIAALGSVAVAPTASAAPVLDSPSYIVDGPGKGNGPDAFIVTDHGRKPVFFCDPEQPQAHKKTCVALVEDGGTRF